MLTWPFFCDYSWDWPPCDTRGVVLAGTCYLGIAMSSLKEPIVKKVHADGDSREHRVQHKDFFAEQALQMVMEHL